MKSLELFTGAGGLALGTHLSGFEHVALVEWNKDACDTLRRNSRERALPGVDRWTVLQTDIHTLDFNQFGPDFEGQTRRLRTFDGVHFTQPGARKLAHYVEREIRRVMQARATPVATIPTEPEPEPERSPP